MLVMNRQQIEHKIDVEFRNIMNSSISIYNITICITL